MYLFQAQCVIILFSIHSFHQFQETRTPVEQTILVNVDNQNTTYITNTGQRHVKRHHKMIYIDICKDCATIL